MAVQSGKMKSSKSKPSLWTLLVKKPGNGSGDGHINGCPSVYDRRHHILQLQLISPLLFDTLYSDYRMNYWFQEVHFVESIKINEKDFNSKLAEQAWKEAYLFVELYNDYQSVASDTEWNTVKSVADKHHQLHLILSELSSLNWFDEICKNYQNSYKTSASNQVPAALLICIYHYHNSESEDTDVVQSFDKMCDSNLETCRNYHSKGNQYFSDELYEKALQHYTYGLKLHPFHEVLYSNRSQTYMKLDKFKEAEFDAKRAVCLKCDRPKSYYRLIESVEKQGNLHQALELATESLELCEESIGSIDRQALLDLIAVLKEKLNLSSGDTTELSKPSSTNTGRIVIDLRSSPNVILLTKNKETLDSSDVPELLTDSEVESLPSCNTGTNTTVKTKKPKKVRPKTSDAATSTPDLPCKAHDIAKPGTAPLAVQRRRSESETRISLAEFKANVADASVALLAQQCRQASYFYNKVLKDLLYVDGQLSEKEIVVIKYASAFAFSNSGVYTDMMKALDLFQEIIDHHKKISFPLTFYGMACCFYKQNRFKEALNALHKCLEVIELKPLDGTLTWPETSVAIEENEGLKTALKKLEETCKNPPRPDALCRFDKGDHVKPEIYLSDPDFKGYIKVTCLERCVLQFHPNCWKSLKEERFQSNDKEFLGKECLTPDCESSIVEIGHIGSDGDVTKRFVHYSENTTRTGTKQKRSKLEKKLKAKMQKKIQKAAVEPIVDHDAESLVDDSNEVGIEKEVGLQDHKDKDVHTPIQNKENDVTSGQLPASIPAKPSRTKSYQEDISKVPVSMGKAVILKKDEEDEMIKSKVPGHRSERHRKKDKRKQVLTIDEFLGSPHNEVAFVNSYVQRLSKLHAQRNRVEERKRTCISPNSFLKLEEEEPFSIPEHLQQDYEEVRRMVSSAQEEESATTRAIKENFVSYMKDVMKGTGPLHLEDPRLLEEMANLPVELQELICNAGGLKEFMVKSQQFIVLQNRIYCLESTPRRMEVLRCQFYDENFKVDDQSGLASDSLNSIIGDGSKAKVDSLDSFDIEPLSYNKKQTSMSETGQHESSSESEVSDSDLMYEESDENDSCSEISKEHEDIEDKRIALELGSSDHEEDDDNEEISEYSEDEMDDGVGYGSDGRNNNRTVIEAKLDGCVESDTSTNGQSTFRNTEDGILKPSKPVVGSAPPTIKLCSNSGSANNEVVVHTARSGSLDSTSSSSCDISVSGERPNAMESSLRRYLDKFLQFVPRFSEKGQSQILCLLLRIIQNEEILHRHMKDTTGLENMIQNLTLVAGVLNRVSHKAVQTEPDEVEIKLQMKNKEYENEIDGLMQKVQQLELSNQATIDMLQQEHSAALQQLNDELARKQQEVISAQENLEAVTKQKSTADKKLEEMQVSLDKFKSDLDAERKLRIQAHDLSRRLQSELAVSKAISAKAISPQERLNASAIFTPMKTEHRNGTTSLVGSKVQPTPSIPLSANVVPQTVPWSSLPLPTPAGYMPMPPGSAMAGRQLVSAIPNLSASVPTALKVFQPVSQALSARDGSSSRLANSSTTETAATKSLSSPTPTVKQPSASSHVALDDFDDSTRAPSTSSKPAVSGLQSKTCKLSNSEPEMKHAPPPVQPHVAAHYKPPSTASSSAKTSFEKLLGILQPRFPTCSRGDLRNMVQQLRGRRGNTLTGLTMDQIITELSKIMDKQKQGAIPKSAVNKAPFSSMSMGLDRIAEPGVAWQRVPSEKRQWEVNQTEEDPCIICHEEMIGKDICQLQCLHRFHPDCIRQWFREQSTCPTCRVHSILPDEFPPLT